MGTNYYVRKNECDKCGRYEEIHLGKKSSGWVFIFQYNGGEFYKTVEEMKKWVKNKQIWNEYDEKVSYKEFWSMIGEAQKDIKNHKHAEEYPSEYDFMLNGYSFTNRDFS